MASKKSALIVSAATMASRVLGLVRDVVFGAMFGASRMMDSYLAAFQIPNLLRDMFAEGALSQAFTSTFTKLWEKEGEASAWELAQIVFSTILLVLGIICLIGIATSFWLVLVLNPGFLDASADGPTWNQWVEAFFNPTSIGDESKVWLTTTLTQILWPFILFVSVAAMVMGILNSRHHFGLPASASACFNFVAIVAGVGFACLFDPQEDWTNPEFGERAIYGVALGVLLGGVAQLAIQVPLLWKIGFRFKWNINFRDPRLITVLKLMVPTVMAAMAVQVNVLINNGFVSYVPGGRTWYTYAFRLFQFPVGVFGVAIATVTLPAVARFKAAEDTAGFGKAVEDALRFAFYLTIPASIGLAVLAPQIVKLVFQYGNFDADDAQQTAYALQAFAVGIAGYSGIKVLIPCFIALNQPKTPFKVSCIAIVVNLILASIFFWVLGWQQVGLALTVALVILINFAQLLFYMNRQVNVGTLREWIGFAARMAVAVGTMGAIAWGGGYVADQMENRFAFMAVTLATVGAAGAMYFAVSWGVRMRESVELISMVRRKLGR